MTHADRGTVVVPQFVGLHIRDARGLANAVDVVLTSGDPDGPPLGSLTWPGQWFVTGQQPSSGTVVASGSWVVITFEERGGGGAGDREPRTPRPPTPHLAAERDHPASEPG